MNICQVTDLLFYIIILNNSMKEQPRNTSNNCPAFQKKTSQYSNSSNHRRNTIKGVTIVPHQPNSNKHIEFPNKKLQMPVSSDAKIPQKVHESNSDLLKELVRLSRMNDAKKGQILNIHKQHRIQLVRNQKLKTQYAQEQKNMQSFKRRHIKAFKQEHANHKESPLFYNQKGLSPFQLILLQQSRYGQMEGNICMVCFVDLEPNTKILVLPCGHYIHKDCGVQHLLYSKQCPACGQFVIIEQ